MAKVLKHILVSIILLLIAVACNNGGCDYNQSSIPLAGFYSSAPTPKKLSIDSISVFGLDQISDSMLLKNAQTVSQVYLPFRINTNATTYVIHYDQKGVSDPLYNDTISFTYNKYPYFDSVECGAMYRFEVTDVKSTDNMIDSVRMVSNMITNMNLETIKIYFKIADTNAE